MLALKYLETNFNNLSIKIKIELVFFPLIIFFIFVFFSQDKTSKFTSNIKTSFASNSNKVVMNNEILDILNDLEKFILANKIQLNKISNNKQSIKIELKTNIVKQLLFIKFIEDYNSFSKVNYFKQEKDLLSIEIIFDRLYMKNAFKIKNELISLKKNINTKFKLFAIIDNSVLINNKWLKIKDSVDSFQITEIKDNSVYLSNGLKMIKLKINKNENN